MFLRQLSSVPRSRHYYCRSADCSHSPTPTTTDGYISRFHPLRSGVTDGSHGGPCERDAPPSRAALAVSHERWQSSCSTRIHVDFHPQSLCPSGASVDRGTQNPPLRLLRFSNLHSTILYHATVVKAPLQAPYPSASKEETSAAEGRMIGPLFKFEVKAASTSGLSSQILETAARYCFVIHDVPSFNKSVDGSL